ncbi:hypothetical protein [Nocardia sp. NPDC052566]|uniref:hypothetical protein n=1 Tax=Nocardia sp. NPDC052566 TaxID=3364330 RepID=UPI0037CBF41B
MTEPLLLPRGAGQWPTAACRDTGVARIVILVAAYARIAPNEALAGDRAAAERPRG